MSLSGLLERCKNMEMERSTGDAPAPKRDLKALLRKTKNITKVMTPAVVGEPAAPAVHVYVIKRVAGQGLGVGLTQNCEVNTVKAGEPADSAGIPLGARIVEVNGVAIENKAEFAKELKSASLELSFTLAPGRLRAITSQAEELRNRQLGAPPQLPLAPQLPTAGMASSSMPPPVPVMQAAQAPPVPALPQSAKDTSPSKKELESVDAFVARMSTEENPDALVASVRASGDPNFSFLDPSHPLHGFYKYQLTQTLEALAALKAMKAAKLSPTPSRDVPPPAPSALPVSTLPSAAGIRLGAGAHTAAAAAPSAARTLSGNSAALDWKTIQKMEMAAIPASEAAPQPEALVEDALVKDSSDRMELPLPYMGGGVIGTVQEKVSGTVPLTEVQKASLRAPRQAVLVEAMTAGNFDDALRLADRLSTISTRSDVGRRIGGKQKRDSSESDSSDSSERIKRKKAKKRRKKDEVLQIGAGPAALPIAPTGRGMPPTDYLCSSCKRRGHWSEECPLAKESATNAPPSSYKCPACQKPGHWAKDCPTKQQPVQDDAQKREAVRVKCKDCGEVGHWTAECPRRREPRMIPRSELPAVPRILPSRGGDRDMRGPRGDRDCILPSRGGDRDCILPRGRDERDRDRDRDRDTRRRLPEPRDRRDLRDLTHSQRGRDHDKRDVRPTDWRRSSSSRSRDRKDKKKDKKEKKDKKGEKDKKEKKDKKDKKDKKEKKDGRSVNI